MGQVVLNRDGHRLVGDCSIVDVAAEVWAGLPGRQSLRSAWFVGQQRARGNNGIGWMHAVVPGSRLFSSGLWLRRAEGAR